jgi:flagellar basal body rod protein FlgC
MGNISGIAQSGLSAAATQLGVSAQNVANALTDGFVPSRVDLTEAAGGGVTATVSRPADPAGEARADRALLAASGTDLVSEMVAQRQAAAAYRANLATLRTAVELQDEVLKLKP